MSRVYNENMLRLGSSNQYKHQFSYNYERTHWDPTIMYASSNATLSSSGEGSPFATPPRSVPGPNMRITRSITRCQQQSTKSPSLSTDKPAPDSGALQNDQSQKTNRGQQGRFFEDFESNESVHPPPQLVGYGNRFSYTLVHSHNPSIASVAANSIKAAPTPRRSHRIEQMKRIKAQQQQIPPRHVAEKPVRHQYSSPTTRTTPPAPLTSALKPQPQPLPRLRDSLGRPTAFALDRPGGRYPRTDPRSVNNLVDYEWLRQRLRKWRRQLRRADPAEMQRSGAPRYFELCRAELVPVRAPLSLLDDDDDDDDDSGRKKTENKRKGKGKGKKDEEKGGMMWVVAADEPDGPWRDVNWGGSSAAANTIAGGGKHGSGAAQANSDSRGDVVGDRSSEKKEQETKHKRKRGSSSREHKNRGRTATPIPLSPSPSPSSASRKSTTQRLRKWFSRRFSRRDSRLPGTSDSSSSSTTATTTTTDVITTMATTTLPLPRDPIIIATTAAVAPPRKEALETDEEAQTAGPLGERKYGEGEYAAVVALAGSSVPWSRSVPLGGPPFDAWASSLSRELGERGRS
ncbi:hypothetical protein F5X99DRAFT_430017 [Biscogniauxia marginata]|nr:hypothetical protein F5X99DRAFT_430017 [Biscogniauxia marginata]